LETEFSNPVAISKWVREVTLFSGNILKYDTRHILPSTKFGNIMKQSTFLLVTATIIGLLLVASFGWSLKPTAHANPNNTDWQLSVTGLVENPSNLTLADLKAMPQTTEYATLCCVDDPGYAIAEGNWTGVQLWTLLEKAGVSPNSTKVAFFASDGFSADLPITTAQQSNIVLAYAENGNPLPEVLRLVVPGEWGYKWIDKVTTIQLVNFNYLGTEESQGYDDYGVAVPIGTPIPPALPLPIPSLSPSPTSHFFTTPSPSGSPFSAGSPSPTLATLTQPGKQTPPMTNYTFITVIAILIATATAAVILRKSKQTKNKKQVQTASPG
jgi:hypothetical protein